MAVLLGAESVAQAKTLIQSIKSNAYNGGATGVVPPQRRQPLSSSASRKEIDYSYNGYFTLKLIEIVNEDLSKSYKVRIVDGATYDPDTGTSGASTARVNGTTFTIPYIELDIPDTSYYTVVLKYTPKIGEVLAKIEVILYSGYLPTNTTTNSWFQIGRVLDVSGVYTCVQDHTSGLAQLWWYIAC